MTTNTLENPIWHTLATAQSEFALGGAYARRYPATIAPFGAVAAPTPQGEAELIELVEPGEQICVVGIAPPLSAAWKLEKHGEVLQMIYQVQSENSASDPEIQQLTEGDVPAMLALTALVYPAYFRAGTARLGAYYGIYQHGRLAAMAGERMRFAGYQEISAVCTHPDFAGSGYAKRLIKHLVNVILARGDTPFLHVDGDNERAISLYERLSFKASRTLSLWLIRRQGETDSVQAGS